MVFHINRPPWPLTLCRKSWRWGRWAGPWGCILFVLIIYVLYSCLYVYDAGISKAKREKWGEKLDNKLAIESENEMTNMLDFISLLTWNCRCECMSTHAFMRTHWTHCRACPVVDPHAKQCLHIHPLTKQGLWKTLPASVSWRADGTTCRWMTCHLGLLVVGRYVNMCRSHPAVLAVRLVGCMGIRPTLSYGLSLGSLRFLVWTVLTVTGRSSSGLVLKFSCLEWSWKSCVVVTWTVPTPSGRWHSYDNVAQYSKTHFKCITETDVLQTLQRCVA